MGTGRSLFITTKNLDYIRNTQEIAVLQETGQQVDIIGSSADGYAKRLLQVYRKLLCCDFSRYDTIFVGFAPQLILPVFGRKFRKYAGQGGSITIDFFISVYDTMVCDRRKFKEASVGAGLCKWVDQTAMDMAHRVIVDTKAHGRYFHQMFGVQEEKLEVLYLQADTDLYYPHSVNRESLFGAASNQKIVLYFGSILPLQGVDIILRAISIMEAETDIHFIMIGPLKAAGEMNIPKQNNVTYIEWLPQEQLADYIAAADLCLAGHFNDKIEKAKRTIPGKAYIYRALNKPMILGDNEANRELFDESQEGIAFCRMGSAESLCHAIRQCMDKIKQDIKKDE